MRAKAVPICSIGIVLLFGTLSYASYVEVDHFDASLAQLALVTPLGVEAIDLTGPSTMHVFFEGATVGSADDDNGNILDEVPTEMVELNLTGFSSMFGTVNMRLRPGFSALGEMEETADLTTGVLDVPPFAPDGTTVDSFFDVFFEIDILALGQTFHTINPMRLSSIITHKPPAPTDIYENLQDIQLYDENGQPTDFFIGAIHYRPNPCLRCSDFDQTNGTDMLDLGQLAASWLWTESIGDSYNAADLNCDWTVNFLDFAIFAQNWLLPCP